MICRNCEGGGHTDFCATGCDTPKQKPMPAPAKPSPNEQAEKDIEHDLIAYQSNVRQFPTDVGAVLQAILFCARVLLLIARRLSRVEYAIACLRNPPT